MYDYIDIIPYTLNTNNVAEPLPSPSPHTKLPGNH